MPALIQRKLRVPPLSGAEIRRPRVEELAQALIRGHRVLVVCATAGAGKTTAVVRAVAAQSRPVAWMNVDRTDRAPGRLLAYLEAALQRVLPAVDGVARQALGIGLAHAEAAGLLAESTAGSPVTLVVDDLERLGDETRDAWAVLEAVVQYAPDTMRLVLISRRDLPPSTTSSLSPGERAMLGDGDLAFTPEEASEALAAIGNDAVDAGAAVSATGGWVTGVLFEAWRHENHSGGIAGEADPLYGYLAAQIVDRLTPEDAAFLERTSILEEVSLRNAEALGIEDAADRLRALRAAHLPVSWLGDGLALRCHTRFREYLQARLERRPSVEVRALHAARGRLLTRLGLNEEAVDEYLLAGAREEAAKVAEMAIEAVIERLDLAVADRWLAALEGVDRASDSPLISSELMLSVSREDYRRGVDIADRLLNHHERDHLPERSPRVAALMAWSYLHAGRIADVRALLAVTIPDPTVEAVRYALRPLDEAVGPPGETMPSTSGSAFDALLLRAAYHLGRLAELAAPPPSPWVEAVVGPWRIGALRATGRTEQAMALYKSARAAGVATVGLQAAVGPEVLIDAGAINEARAALAEGRAAARQAGSLIFELFNGVAEAKLELRLAHDPAAAQTVIKRLESELGARRFPYTREMLDTWSGMALLMEDRDEEALERLQRAVDGMRRGGRGLELPTAAVFLAEALWRARCEERADRAADLALEAAQVHGSNHMLLQALADFPTVASRRIDAEPLADSVWHQVGRALLSRPGDEDCSVPSIELLDLGAPTILVDGQRASHRLGKSIELLALLASRRPGGADRDEVLDLLFDGRCDGATRTYLRQAVHQLRQVLPAGAVVSEGGRLALAPNLCLKTRSGRLQARLAEAARMRDEQRLEATIEALTLADRGVYLEGFDGEWVREGRRQLADTIASARHAAAELAVEAGRLVVAQGLISDALRDEPYREATWRLRMRVANALGDYDGVLTAFTDCERALAGVGATASSSTRVLLQSLRR